MCASPCPQRHRVSLLCCLRHRGQICYCAPAKPKDGYSELLLLGEEPMHITITVSGTALPSRNKQICSWSWLTSVLTYAWHVHRSKHGPTCAEVMSHGHVFGTPFCTPAPFCRNNANSHAALQLTSLKYSPTHQPNSDIGCQAKITRISCHTVQ